MMRRMRCLRARSCDAVLNGWIWVQSDGGQEGSGGRSVYLWICWACEKIVYMGFGVGWRLGIIPPAFDVYEPEIKMRNGVYE